MGKVVLCLAHILHAYTALGTYTHAFIDVDVSIPVTGTSSSSSSLSLLLPSFSSSSVHLFIILDGRDEEVELVVLDEGRFFEASGIGTAIE